MTLSKSKLLFERAKKVIPGGVNSPVRAFGAVGGYPPFIKKAKGARIYDADGNEYIDYVGSWGPMILGHSHPRVLEAVSKNNGGRFELLAPQRNWKFKWPSLLQNLYPPLKWSEW